MNEESAEETSGIGLLVKIGGFIKANWEPIVVSIGVGLLFMFCFSVIEGCIWRGEVDEILNRIDDTAGEIKASVNRIEGVLGAKGKDVEEDKETYKAEYRGLAGYEDMEKDKLTYYGRKWDPEEYYATCNYASPCKLPYRTFIKVENLNSVNPTKHWPSNHPSIVVEVVGRFDDSDNKNRLICLSPAAARALYFEEHKGEIEVFIKITTVNE